MESIEGGLEVTEGGVIKVTLDEKNADGTSKEVSLTLNQASNTVEIENLGLSEGNFTMNMSCLYENTEFILPVEFSVLNAVESFYLDINNLTLNDLDNFSLLFTSVSEETQYITIKVDGDYVGFLFSRINA